MIKIDIPMPRCCSDCFALHILDDFGNCRCGITETDVFIESFIDDESKLDNCPLQEVKSASLEEVRCEVQCSDCGAEFSDAIFWMARGNARINYCPNCGAKFEEESK